MQNVGNFEMLRDLKLELSEFTIFETVQFFEILVMDHDIGQMEVLNDTTGNQTCYSFLIYLNNIFVSYIFVSDKLLNGCILRGPNFFVETHMTPGSK